MKYFSDIYHTRFVRVDAERLRITCVTMIVKNWNDPLNPLHNLELKISYSTVDGTLRPEDLRREIAQLEAEDNAVMRPSTQENFERALKAYKRVISQLAN